MFGDFPGLLTNLLLFAGLLILVRSIDQRNEVMRFVLALMAIYFNVRYFHWRLTSTMDPLFSSPESIWQWCFFLAEIIAIFSLSWHLIVLIQRPREAHEKGIRPYQPTKDSPKVDVFIATYNEERELLEPTIRAAKAINYPNLAVHVLDDGNRDWLKQFCDQAGANYITRIDRTGFKSGNLNNALQQVSGTYILCLDADFVVSPNILTEVLGYFDDPSVGIVQTPQYFGNPDAIQFNLSGQQAWPEEQRVFTDIMQPCRDNWDNAFCYGTNFVIRRHCVDKIGGFPTESICEDLLLTYKLKPHGWVTRFHRAPLAIGKAADTLGTFINQRVRWCTGTLQCLFLKEGPIRASGLSLKDRLFFLDTMMYYLSSIWFFFVLASPAVFWWLGQAPFESDNGHILMMFAPRVIASSLVMYWLTDRKVIPVISEIGRFIGIYHILSAIMVTLLTPRSQVFKVTDKNISRDRVTFNWQVAMPHLILLAITMAGMAKTMIFGREGTYSAGENIGLILALSIYMFWITFLCVLACFEPPLANGKTSTASPTTIGSFRRTFHSVYSKVLE